jgi:hypothetical protein
MTPHDEKIKEGHNNEKLKQKETTMMKTKLIKKIGSCSLFACALASLIATVPLGTSATAAPAPGAPVCNGVRMLRGLYIWTFDGYQYFGGNPVAKALMQGIQFNGDGTFILPFATVNVGGTVGDSSGTVGTYTVAADCTGTISVAGGFARFNMYVGPGAQQLWITQTTGGLGDGIGLGVGTATRVQ